LLPVASCPSFRAGRRKLNRPGKRKKLMNQPTKFAIKRVSPARNSVSHSLPRSSFSEGGSLITSHYSLLTVLLLALALAPKAFGVSPAPDGGYGGGNTAEGTNALFSRTTG